MSNLKKKERKKDLNPNKNIEGETHLCTLNENSTVGTYTFKTYTAKQCLRANAVTSCLDDDDDDDDDDDEKN